MTTENKDAISYLKMILDCDKQIEKLRRNRPPTGEQHELSLYFENLYLEHKRIMSRELKKIK